MDPPHLFYNLLMVLNSLANYNCFAISHKSGLRVSWILSRACSLLGARPSPEPASFPPGNAEATWR